MFDYGGKLSHFSEAACIMPITVYNKTNRDLFY